MTDTNTYDIQLFENTEFGKLTVLTFEDSGDTVWFIGKEVAEMLGYVNTKDALSKHVDTEDKRVVLRSQITTLENIPNRGLTCINESGLYSLILSSKLSSAKKFKRWVTSDVLPSIRKHGLYATDELLNDPDLAIKAFTALKEERQARLKAEQKVKSLTAMNNELALTNAALAKETNTWDHRKILDALIKKYAFRCLNGDIGWGYNKFIYTFDKKMGTKLRGRKDENGKQYSSGMKAIRTEELPSALGIIVALCIAGGINLEWAIGKDNVEILEQMGIETE